MMKKLLPIIIALVGLGGGLAGGTAMKPQSNEVDHSDDGKHTVADGKGSTGEHGKTNDHASATDSHGNTADGHGVSDELIYVGLAKPFFVPVLRRDNNNVLVRLDIHLEVPDSLKSSVEKHEPKLRDAFLRTVMNFSHDGGFTRVHDGEGFTILRDDLLVSARKVLGSKVKTVLIGEILTRES